MIELMIAVYGTILWLVFKKFKLVPVNQWTVVTSILIGGVMLGFVLLMMNMYQPVSPDGRLYAALGDGAAKRLGVNPKCWPI